MTNLFARKSGVRQILVAGSAPNSAVAHNVHRALVV
jgi:hypothetical protein